MPIYFNESTERFFVKFTYNWKTTFRRLPKGATRKDAERLEIKLKNQQFFEHNGLQPKQNEIYEHFVSFTYLPFVEANNAPGAADSALTIIEASMPFFRGMTLRSIKPADIEKFKTARMRLPTMHNTVRKPATIVRELSVISRVFSLAVKNDLCESNPCSRVQRPKYDNVQDRILSLEDEPELFAHLHGQWATDVCRMALNTGLRQNDILTLTKFNIDWNNNVVKTIQGKTKRLVTVKMNTEVHRILRSRWHTDSEWLFTSPVTGLPKGSVRHSLARACERAQIPRVTIRDLRRTFGTRMQDNGIDTVTVSRVLGHKDLRSIHRYQRSTDTMQKAVDSLVNRSNIVSLDKKERAIG